MDGKERKQIGVRIAANLIIEAKVLAVRRGCNLNEVVEEALEDLLKKYREKKSRRDGH